MTDQKPSFSIRDAMTIAAAKVGIQGWQAYQWEMAEGGHLVTGEVPGGTYLRGPRKGQPRFKHKDSTHERRVVVAESDLLQAAATYEADSGKCWDCKGDGKTVAGWSRAEGTRYRVCCRCNGNGRAAAMTGEGDKP